MFRILLILLLINNEGDSESTTKTYYGFPDSYNQFPFVVSIETSDKAPNSEPIKFCTGSLIKQSWIITAAHCLMYENVTVSYGDTISRQLAMKAKVLAQIKHPHHKIISNKEDWHVTNDIGLMKVEQIPINPLGKLSKIDYKEFIESPVVYVGYGFISMRSSNSAELTRQLKDIDNIPLLVGHGETTKCDLKIVWHPGICVLSKQKMGRIADPGGPLLHNGRIIGIFSGMAGKEMVYVPVNLYLVWIHDTILKENQKQHVPDNDKINNDKDINDANKPTIDISLQLTFEN